MKTNQSTWTSEVRDYEVDFQGIVNNACYFVNLSREGINIVLIESNIK